MKSVENDVDEVSVLSVSFKYLFYILFFSQPIIALWCYSSTACWPLALTSASTSPVCCKTNFRGWVSGRGSSLTNHWLIHQCQCQLSTWQRPSTGLLIGFLLPNRTWRVPMQQWSMGRLTVCWDWGWALSSTTFFMPSTPGRKRADLHNWWWLSTLMLNPALIQNVSLVIEGPCEDQEVVGSIPDLGYAEVHGNGTHCSLSWCSALRVGLEMVRVKWQQSRFLTLRFETVDDTLTFNP